MAIHPWSGCFVDARERQESYDNDIGQYCYIEELSGE